MSTLSVVLLLGVAALPDGGVAPCPREGATDGCGEVTRSAPRRVGDCRLFTERTSTAVRCDSSGDFDRHESESAWVTSPDGGVDRERRLAFDAPGCEDLGEHAEATELDGGFLVHERVSTGDLSQQREDGSPDVTVVHVVRALVVNRDCRFARVSLTGAFADAASGERLVIESPDGGAVEVRYSSAKRPKPQALTVTAWTPERLSAEVKFRDGSRYRLAFDEQGVVVTPVGKGAAQRFVPAQAPR